MKLCIDSWIGDDPLAIKFAGLWNFAEKRDATVAELYNENQMEAIWKLVFVRGFYDWELEDVNTLYISLQNQKLDITARDF